MSTETPSRLTEYLRERLSPIWKAATPQLERGWQWLMLRQQVAFISAGVIIVLLLLIFSGVTAAVAAVAAWITLLRHFAQTDADRQRRITESYSKAVEQLANDKIEIRLGGIYTLERISRESSDDYWTVMETLCAFVRGRARRKAPDQKSSETVADNGNGPPTDIAAVLAVIVRRDEKTQQRESEKGWRLDFGSADLRGANLEGGRLEGASFVEAYLEGARIGKAHLKGTKFMGAHLEGANLVESRLEAASLREAHLEKADFTGANLEEVLLLDAHLEGAILRRANLQGANFARASLKKAILVEAHLEGAVFFEASLQGATLSWTPKMRQ